MKVWLHPPVRRDAEAGITLVEMLVMLVIVGVLAGAIGLSIGTAGRETAAGNEAARLATRLGRAGDLAALSGRPAALIWEGDAYRFAEYDSGAWRVHPDPILGTRREMPRGLTLRSEGREASYRIDPDRIPAQGGPLDLRLGGPGREGAWHVLFDGLAGRARRGGAA